MPGMSQSLIITSGSWARNISQASLPSAAVKHSCPSRSTADFNIIRVVRPSSTTRTFIFVTTIIGRFPWRPEPPRRFGLAIAALAPSYGVRRYERENFRLRQEPRIGGLREGWGFEPTASLRSLLGGDDATGRGK